MSLHPGVFDLSMIVHAGWCEIIDRSLHDWNGAWKDDVSSAIWRNRAAALWPPPCRRERCTEILRNYLTPLFTLAVKVFTFILIPLIFFMSYCEPNVTLP